MSGHSKWAQIKHKKSAADVRKSKLFSRLSRMITIAAKHGERDPNTNASLRVAVEKARQANMPANNIERAIARSVEKDAAGLEEVSYEAYGPGGVALLLEGITDNTNRTSNELKHILQKHGGKLAEPGAVSWMFTKKAFLMIPMPQNRDVVELALIDAGAEDITEEGGALCVSAPADAGERLAKVARESTGIDVSFELRWVAQNTVRLNDTQQRELLPLYEALDAHDDIQEIYSNEHGDREPKSETR